MPVPLKWLLAAALTASLSAQELTTRCDLPAGALGRLSRTPDALAELRTLLAQLPPNNPAQSAMAERTAEAALEAGSVLQKIRHSLAVE
jgi:hypothetical protein